MMSSNPVTDKGRSEPTPENPVAESVALPESVKVCPSCNHSGDRAFTTCPRCGLIVRKYHISRHQQETAATSVKGVVRRSVGKTVLTGCCLFMVAVGAVVYLLDRPAPRTASYNSSPSEDASTGSAKKTLTDAGQGSSPGDTLPNDLGITVQKVIFASDADANGIPVNDLTRVPFNGKKVVVRVKMLIPPEKSYQFTGKFYDGEGKLVMNVTSPSIPTLSIWHAWYYHNLDRADDKPGTWKYVFLVNDKAVLEKAVEVAEF